MSARSDVKSYPGFFAMTMLCMFILYAPLIVVTIYSFNAPNSITVWEGLSLRWYADVFVGPESGKFKQAAFSAGLICYPMGGTIDGRQGDHVLLAPPFIATDAHLEELVDKLATATERVLSDVGVA